MRLAPRNPPRHVGERTCTSWFSGRSRGFAERCSGTQALSSILAFAGNHVADATPRSCDITPITRYEMNVSVSNGLARNSSAIYTNVEAVWSVFSFQVLSHGPDQVEACVIVIDGQLENGAHVFLGNDQRVAARHGVPVIDGERVFILEDDLGHRVAERARGHRVSLHRKTQWRYSRSQSRQYGRHRTDLWVLVTLGLNGSVVDENICAVLLTDEPVALGWVKPSHFSLTIRTRACAHFPRLAGGTIPFIRRYSTICP